MISNQIGKVICGPKNRLLVVQDGNIVQPNICDVQYNLALINFFDYKDPALFHIDKF